jgi:Asp-tRNA(Asn)/Glu-tRNA(Gln) amidotransferase A subunit family amidase
MNKLWQLGAAELVRGYRDQLFSPVEVVSASIERAQYHAEPLNALCQPRYEQALKEALKYEQRFANLTCLTRAQ